MFPSGLGSLAAGRGERRHSRCSAGQGRGEMCGAAAARPNREGGEACVATRAPPLGAEPESLRGEHAGGSRAPRGLGSRVRSGAGETVGEGAAGVFASAGSSYFSGGAIAERSLGGGWVPPKEKGRGQKVRKARGFSCRLRWGRRESSEACRESSRGRESRGPAGRKENVEHRWWAGGLVPWSRCVCSLAGELVPQSIQTLQSR